MARGRDFGPAADHRAVQHRHHRSLAELDALEGAMPAARMRDALRDVAGGELAKIEARAEMIALGGEHHGLDGVRQRGKECLDAEHGRVVDGVALCRARGKRTAMSPRRSALSERGSSTSKPLADLLTAIPRSSKVSRAFGDISAKTGQALTPPRRRRAGPRASRARFSNRITVRK